MMSIRNALCPYVKLWRIIHQNTLHWSSLSSLIRKAQYISKTKKHLSFILQVYISYFVKIFSYMIPLRSRVIIFWCAKILRSSFYFFSYFTTQVVTLGDRILMKISSKEFHVKWMMLVSRYGWIGYIYIYMYIYKSFLYFKIICNISTNL